MAESKDRQVENALFKKCVGYQEVTEKPIKLKRVEYSDAGKKILEEEFLEYATEKRWVEPNVTAIAMYLKNRMPEKWGNQEMTIPTQIQLEVLED